MKMCIYGGQFGSEGKGSASEYWAGQLKGGRLIVAGENGPNSGHTNTVGKTRNLPVAGFFADKILMGPDSIINIDVMLEDLEKIKAYRGKIPTVYIHEHAAVATQDDINLETAMGLDLSVGSTVTGSGAARGGKYFNRLRSSIIGRSGLTLPDCVQLLTTIGYLKIISCHVQDHWIFECSQGTMLDTNFGYYPFVTSRTTLPRAAIERNGLGELNWHYAGVYRTFPIRTGGNSGPTGQPETNWDLVGVTPEQASVTKRTRRVFQFSSEDFEISLAVTRPDVLMFTHLDYIGYNPLHVPDFIGWLTSKNITPSSLHHAIYLSKQTGAFHHNEDASHQLLIDGKRSI